MMTKKQKRKIYASTRLAVGFQDIFDREWTETVEKLKDSRVDLSKIKLTMGGGGRG